MTIEEEVIEWAKGCDVEFEQPTTIEEHVIFVTTLIRLRAAQDMKWFWQKVERDPEQVIGWTPNLGRVVIGGIEFPPVRMTWVEWFESIRQIEGM